MTRTSDFSQGPPQARATAMFLGATRYSGLRAIAELTPMWRRMVREMRRSPGYLFHRLYYQFPFTIGTFAFFSNREALLTFGRSAVHRELMCWLTDQGTRNAKAGFIRFYAAEPHGYSNGTWRAEDGSMSHIPTWTPLPAETDARPVHRP